MPIAQPQRMMIAGVRQEEERETGPSSPACVDMVFLISRWRIRKGQPRVRRLMQMHENPKPKMIAFHEGLPPEHCVSSRPSPTRRA
jgi:hypothetical protein